MKADYLSRKVEANDTLMHVTGDLTATTDIKVIGGAPERLERLVFNSVDLLFYYSRSGTITTTAVYA